MNIVNVRHCLDRIEKNKSVLENLKKLRDLLDFGGHQEPLVITLGGVRHEVSFCNRNYQHQVRRGYEMIHLGAIKVANAAIDEAKQNLVDLEAELKALVGGQ